MCKTPPSASQTPPLKGEAFTLLFKGFPSKGTVVQRLPSQGLRSRAPPAADTARRSRGSSRRMQAPLQGAQHDARTATRPGPRSGLRGPTSRPRSTFRNASPAGSRPRPTSWQWPAFHQNFYPRPHRERPVFLAGRRPALHRISYLLSLIFYLIPRPPRSAASAVTVPPGAGPARCPRPACRRSRRCQRPRRNTASPRRPAPCSS